jgi:hypothetical protein
VTPDEPALGGSAALPRRPRMAVLGALRIGLGGVILLLGLAASLEAWCGVAYLAGLYSGLGSGMLAALLAGWVIVASVTLLPAGWALWPLQGRPGFRRARRSGVLLGLAAAALLIAYSHSLAQPTRSAMSSEHLSDAALARQLSQLSELARRLPLPRRAPPLAITAPVRCARPPAEAPVTLVAAFLERRPLAPSLSCLQGDELGPVLSDLRTLLLERAARGPIELELISGWQRLGARHAWLDGAKLRPGLDGVCFEKTCVLPWQLLFEGAFSTYRPLEFIPDLQFGVAPEALRRDVRAPPGDGVAGLTRLTTRSFAIDLAAEEPAVTPLTRMRRSQVAVTERTLERAERDAEQYVLRAQLPDGRFRYTLDPMTGVADTQGFNLPRQAGTLLVLCELGRSPRAARAIELGLAAFEPFVRSNADLLAASVDAAAPVARLGESALPLVSMLACAAERRLPLGPSVPGLARLILRLQRPDGGFAPGLDWHAAVPLEGPEPLYATGQALMALVMLEHRQQNHPSSALPPYDELHAAVEHAMQYYAERYWSHPLRDFFFLEENWHCLAARAALGVHRHPGYERFCLDYVRFKSRLILSAEAGVEADFDGGFGFGHLVPPHNTGAAGFGEALSAAISILEARDESSTAQRVLLERVLGFLLRQQWSSENCFACASRDVIGGMSEHTHSAVTRIDFAQHAWAAIGHGRRALQGTLPSE